MTINTNAIQWAKGDKREREKKRREEKNDR
jgi:hypothetical protein